MIESEVRMSPKIEGIEGIEGNRSLWKGGRTIAMAKFFVHVVAGSIGFQRVAVLAIGLVRKGANDF